MILALPLLISLVGLLMYALSANPKVSEIGRIMFWVGLLAFLIDAPGHYAALLPR